MTELSSQGPHTPQRLLWGLATGQGRGDGRAFALGVLSRGGGWWNLKREARGPRRPPVPAPQGTWGDTQAQEGTTFLGRVEKPDKCEQKREPALSRRGPSS